MKNLNKNKVLGVCLILCLIWLIACVTVLQISRFTDKRVIAAELTAVEIRSDQSYVGDFNYEGIQFKRTVDSLYLESFLARSNQPMTTYMNVSASEIGKFMPFVGGVAASLFMITFLIWFSACMALYIQYFINPSKVNRCES